MNLKERVREGLRSFLLGPGVVEPTDEHWGHDSAEYQPAEYGTYVATSNAVYACVTGRAQLLASLPLRFYSRTPDNVRKEITKGPLVDLMRKVNPHWTPNRLKRMTEQALGLWGAAFWFVDRGVSGKLPPREIWWARPDRVRVIPDKDDYIKGYLYVPKGGGKPVPFEPGEVIWFRFPNANDEYSGLSPLAAARLAADVGSAAMQSNLNIFAQGLQIGGRVQPAEGAPDWTVEQAKELERSLARRFKGVDKAHRWAVFRSRYDMEEMGVSPKDAEWLGALNWSLEDVCRAYKWPTDLAGGKHTYENVAAAMKAAWTHCVLPEAAFIAEEIQEQLVPMFPSAKNAEVEFDSSKVEVLQEDREEIVGQVATLAGVGVPLNPMLNEWLPQLLPGDDVPPELTNADGTGWAWGDVAYIPLMMSPVMTTGKAELPRSHTRQALKVMEYGGEAHRRIWRKFERRSLRWQEKFGEAIGELFRRQRDSVLDRLRERAKRSPEAAALEPFNQAQWVREFREMMRPLLAALLGDVGQEALDDIGLDLVFDISEPEIVRFMEVQAQSFAVQVNETTWERLRAGLAEGIEAGESAKELAARVTAEMEDRIRSSALTIARTEVNTASNGGTLLAWEQSQVVQGKMWVSALLTTTRDHHASAHGQTRKMGEDFVLDNGATGPTPGQMGSAGDNINCLCTMVAVTDIEMELGIF